MGLAANIETALVSYLESHIRRAGLTIRRARDGGGPVEGPLLVVEVQGATLHPQIPPSGAARLLDAEFRISGAAVEGKTPGGALRTLGEVENALLDLTSLQSAMNKPASGADKRNVQALTIHQSTPAGYSPSPTEGRNTHFSLRFRLALTPADP